MRFLYLISILLIFLFSCKEKPEATIHVETGLELYSVIKPEIDSTKIPYVYRDTLIMETEYSSVKYPNFLSDDYEIIYSDELMVNNEGDSLTIQSFIPGTYYFKQKDHNGNLILDIEIEVILTDSVEEFRKHILQQPNLLVEQEHFKNAILYNKNLMNQPLKDFTLEAYVDNKIDSVSIYDLLEKDKINVLLFSYEMCGSCEELRRDFNQYFNNDGIEHVNLIYISRDFLTMKKGNLKYELNLPKSMMKKYGKKELVELPFAFAKYAHSTSVLEDEFYYDLYPTTIILDKNYKIRSLINGYRVSPKPGYNYMIPYFLNQVEMVRNVK